MSTDDTRSRLQALRVRVDALPGTEWKQWLSQLLTHVDALLAGFVDSLDCLAWRELADARTTLLHRGPGDETERAIVDVLAEVEAIAEQVTLSRFASRWQCSGFLIADDRSRLLEWVSRAMTCEVERRTAISRDAASLARHIGLYVGWKAHAQAIALVQREQRSRGRPAWDGLADNDHNALIGYVARALDLSDSVARDLCEAAGWPS